MQKSKAIFSKKISPTLLLYFLLLNVRMSVVKLEISIAGEIYFSCGKFNVTVIVP